jgi:transcriptional regulator with XRE-family HTH domain
VDYLNRQYENRLKVIRQNAGYSQRQVAKFLGLKTYSSLCDWENEKTMPNATNLIKLCKLYNKSPNDLYPDYYRYSEERSFKCHG